MNTIFLQKLSILYLSNISMKSYYPKSYLSAKKFGETIYEFHIDIFSNAI